MNRSMIVLFPEDCIPMSMNAFHPEAKPQHRLFAPQPHASVATCDFFIMNVILISMFLSRFVATNLVKSGRGGHCCRTVAAVVAVPNYPRHFAASPSSSHQNPPLEEQQKQEQFQAELANLLEKVEDELKEAAKQPYGKKRGKQIIYQQLLESRPTKKRKGNKNPPQKVTHKRALAHLESLLLKRHALQHGALKFKDLNTTTLAKSFLGSNTRIKKIPQKDAKKIVIRLWRYGRCGLLEEYQEKDAKLGKQAKLRKQQAAAAQAVGKEESAGGAANEENEAL